MEKDEARRRFASARVATLASVDRSGAPHLVPVVFTVEGATVWSATDAKPKRSGVLRRHANISANPSVSLLVQHWHEQWEELWWVRADGTGSLHSDPSTVAHVVRLLREKYPQYDEVAVGAPLVAVTVRTWRGWRALP